MHCVLYITLLKLVRLIFGSGGKVAPQLKNYSEEPYSGTMVRLYTHCYINLHLMVVRGKINTLLGSWFRASYYNICK
jgi:acetylglutamate kinase